MTLLELAETVLRSRVGERDRLRGAAGRRPQVRQPDITRAQQVLGWEPEIDLDEGLRRSLVVARREAALRRPLASSSRRSRGAARRAGPAASASRYIQNGIFDDAQIHYGDPDKVFPSSSS